jgi:large repetitive protein
MRFTKTFFIVALLALVAVPVAFALRFTDASLSPPNGETGKSYSFQLDGAGGCGPGLPYQFSILSGSLPPGLSLAKSGLISGTPTQGGAYSFWVELSDQNPPSASWCVPSDAQRQLTITVVTGLSIEQNSLKPAATNTPYNVQLTATGGGSQVWSVKSGQLPAGLTLSSSGLISGTPTATGDSTFVVQVTDVNRTDTETYTLSVVQQLKITAPSKSVAGEVGVRFSLALKSSGGRPANTWSVEGTLPAGLTLDAATGDITGTPTAAGTHQVKVVVTDSLGLTDTLDVPLKVATKLAVVKTPLRTARVGHAFRAKLAARGGVGPLKWNILGGRPGLLPAGIKFSARTGEFSGTPTKAGVYRLRMQVVDKLGVKSAVGIILTVNA